jgi:hypothetical protein
MAFVVATKGGRYEVRESRHTPAGPRSRTLATFTEMDEEVIARVLERADSPPTPEELRAAALRAGAPLADRPVDAAGRETLRLLAQGARLDPTLGRLLLDTLNRQGSETAGGRPGEVSDNARAAAAWSGVAASARSAALGDLLQLADALPFRKRGAKIGFPRLASN